MNVHHEIGLEDEICASLAAAGWLYDEGDAKRYDAERALFPEDLVAWVRETQPDAWERLEGTWGASAADKLCDSVRRALDRSGAVHVLRRGIEMVGLRRELQLAQFRPAMGRTPRLLELYAANRLRVVRQVRYAVDAGDSIDLVLFLNGIPVATAELKTDFTQSVDNAVDQYRLDRPPHPKGKRAEPLLGFPGGAIVHFAVSDSAVKMTTKLEGEKTFFLPFNQGDRGAAGNPPNKNGHATAYLWEEVWARESWLEIIGRYVIEERDDKSEIRKLIFPRYHQLDATRKIVKAVREEGPGGRFIIQHSAGSGKTNSIAWTAHFLADLHDAEDRKMFATVIVVSDRRVIDGQLQDAIFSFERNTGVVETIKGEGGSKSGQLAEALKAGKKIIVCTIQTFPFALEQVRALTAAEGKSFAVIADEAHSSQTGQAAAKLKEMLSAEEREALEDGGELSAEDILNAQMTARARETGVTYVAFTATPKGKTIELFGRRPDPAQPGGPDNLPGPFHVYSMRQAIEEGFILDVLRNYTPYDLAFKLAQRAENGELEDALAGAGDAKVDKKQATYELMRLVALHPYNISQKVALIVEHFRRNVAPLLGGRAKAMIVVHSRKEAVRWKLALDRYIADQGYKLGALVAFSGEVQDDEAGGEGLTEKSERLNPGLRGRDIRKVFDGADYQLLLVANKFQTGFDQPLLCGMYVDRKLSGIQAVQTLSRLNRWAPGKTTTYVLDFANSAEDVLKAFRTYYETAEMAAETDPELVFDLRRKLDATGFYDQHEVDRVVEAALAPKASHKRLSAAAAPVADRLMKRFAAAKQERDDALRAGDEATAASAKDRMDALLLFRSDCQSYVSLYGFLSQVLDFGSTELEKRSIFYRLLTPLLEFGRDRVVVDLGEVELTHHRLIKREDAAMALGAEPGAKLAGMTAVGGGRVQDKNAVLLAEIIDKLNDLFGAAASEENKVNWFRALMDTTAANPKLKAQARHNTSDQFDSSPTLDNCIEDAVLGNEEEFGAMTAVALNSPSKMAALKDLLLRVGGLYERLREEA
ncbi:type I restriction enzyme, R subunit [Albimonas donghaensis]|uniref:Type I restriction enzyme, R subunit n=1 Tax=Albimonas donghaensis TaxID=356660 RepID=A0A1H3A010_9RHOB|nr:DEAD/DEAH box helicase family protein [Albimonas donghaensis]SDX22923.1 type I restriction enzyme, R subunit [Albimonas donghaensis]